MTQKELNECFGREYQKADQQLNRIYRKALDLMQSDLDRAREASDNEEGKIIQTSIANLKAAERAWIQYRDLHCRAAAHEGWGGSMTPMVWAQCMSEVTQHRILDIRNAYEFGDRKLD